MAIQLTVLYNPPTDPAAFDRHYDEVHAPLVATMPGVRSYTVARPRPDENGAPAYHLVATLTFDSQEAMAGAMASEEGAATVADLANFAQAGTTILTGPVDTVV